MTVAAGRPTKGLTHRVLASAFDVAEFPPTLSDGAGVFRDKFEELLGLYAVPQQTTAGVLSPLSTWHVGLRAGAGVEIVLEITVEDVPRSQNPYCEHCRVVGWSKHPVCTKRYHFIIRNEHNTHFKQQLCPQCQSMMELHEGRCSSCGYTLEETVHIQLGNQSHLLHGIVHSNGFGHLAYLNGLAGGSRTLTGVELMTFWDRLCTKLNVRKVTLMDISKKHGMEYRLLHAVVAGYGWYGNWGYNLGSSSFGITPDDYKRAVAYLSSLPLSLIAQTRAPHSQVRKAIAYYRTSSDSPLVTLRDLLIYVADLCYNDGEESDSKSHPEGEAVEKLPKQHSWSAADVAKTTDAMLKVLEAADRSLWVPHRTLKRAVSSSTRSLELIDHCLENIDDRKTEDGQAVVVRYNEETDSIEYRLDYPGAPAQSRDASLYTVTRDRHLRDLRLFYDAFLNPYTIDPDLPLAIQEQMRQSGNVILDYKKFVKHYDEAEKTSAPSAGQLRIWCHITQTDEGCSDLQVPPELVVLPSTATISDLKDAAAKAFRETYLIFERFQAECILDCQSATGETSVALIFGANGHANIGGSCFNGRDRRLAQFRMERGTESWTVGCRCGATDDDGERMLACDRCGVWWHTRCSFISDFLPPPKRFVCSTCKAKSKKSGLGVYRWVTYKKRAKRDPICSSPSLLSAIV